MYHGMRKKLLIAVTLLFWVSSAPIFGDIQKIMVFGDSLSAGYGIDVNQGWVKLLEQRLAKKSLDIKVINASISGNTSGNGLRRIESDLQAHQPDLLILELGGNDGLRGHPPQRLKQNLITMIELCKARGIEVLLVSMQLPPSYGKRYTSAFASVYPAVAEETGVPLVAEFIDNIGTQPDLMQRDGIHPNEKGQPLLLANIWMKLEAMITD